MSAGAGLPQYIETLNAKLGNLMLQLNQTFTAIGQLYTEITGLGSTAIQNLPSSTGNSANQASAGDATSIINAITDAQHLATIYSGGAFLTGGNSANSATYTVATNSGNGTFGYDFRDLNIGKTFGFGS